MNMTIPLIPVQRKIRERRKKKFFSTFAPNKATDLSEAERFLKEPVGSRDQLEKYPTIKKIYK